MLGWDFKDEVWSRFVFELVIWPNRLLWKDELNPRVRCAFGNVKIDPLLFSVKFTRQYVIIDHQPIVCATPHAFGVYDNNAIFNTLLILPPYIHSSRLFQEEKNATLRLQCTPLKKSELKEVTLIWAWCVLPLGTPGTCVITARVGYHPAQHTWS